MIKFCRAIRAIVIFARSFRFVCSQDSNSSRPENVERPEEDLVQQTEEAVVQQPVEAFVQQTEEAVVQQPVEAFVKKTEETVVQRPVADVAQQQEDVVIETVDADVEQFNVEQMRTLIEQLERENSDLRKNVSDVSPFVTFPLFFCLKFCQVILVMKRI
jgi:predicted oxidoreductase